MPVETFISIATVAKLYSYLIKIRKEKADIIDFLGDEFGDPIILSRYYIQPSCQEKNPADFDERQGIANIRQPVFDFLNDHFRSQMIESDGRKHLFILSDAGMGKTSLLLMLRLSKLTSFWPKRVECEIIKLGQDSLSRIRKIKNKKNTLLLLDALDEDTKSYGQIEERIATLIDATKGFFRVIISCRTQFFPEGDSGLFGILGTVNIEGYTCPKIYLSLFSDTQVESYLEKRYGKDSRKISKAKDIVKNMGSLRFRPLLLSYMDDFLRSKITNWSEYSIFENLVKAWLLREERKFKSVIQKKVEWSTLHRACILIAVDMQMRRRRHLIIEELQGIINIYPEVGLIEKFDIGGRSLLNRNSDGAYRFSHYAIQEFLVAQWIKEKLYEPGDTPVKATDTILSFLSAGEIKQNGIQILDFEDTKYIHKDLCEIKSNKGHFESADFSHTAFRYSKLKECNFKSSTLTMSDFSNTSVIGCNFDDVNANRVDFTSADCRYASFSRANLIESHFALCNANSANFEYSDLRKSNLRKSILWGVSFRNAELSKSDLTGAVLVECDLTGANFSNSILKNARMYRCNTDDTIFNQATCNNLKVFETNFSQAQKQTFPYELVIEMSGIYLPDYERIVEIQKELEEFSDDTGTFDDLAW